MKHALLRYPLRARKFQPTLVPAQPTLVLLQYALRTTIFTHARDYTGMILPNYRR